MGSVNVLAVLVVELSLKQITVSCFDFLDFNVIDLIDAIEDLVIVTLVIQLFMGSDFDRTILDFTSLAER